MSLRVRLVLVIVTLVALVVVALSTVYLYKLVNLLSDNALDGSRLASKLVNAFIIDYITRHSEEFETGASLEDIKAQWNDIVISDRDQGIADMLEKTMALSPAIVEINVAGQTGQVLASSNPHRLSQSLIPLKEFAVWRNRPFYNRLIDLVGRRPDYPDYQVMIPLGFVGQTQPIFTVQVVASSVLLRNELLPGVQWLVLVSGGGLLASLLLTTLATNWVLRPVKRIEQTIDRIVQGSFHKGEVPSEVDKEFAIVESKLNILGEQFLGAREAASEKQHSLDQLVERMASQLDVASRLAAISRITGGVAHEIKNPLNAISLHLDLLRARLDAPEEELVAEIDVLSKEVRRLDRVVKTFLDFSRPVEVRFKEVELASLVREVTALMTPQARLAHIDLQFDAPPGDEPMWIRGDADLLKQALLNLVTNALEAMKDAGTLRLAVKRAGAAVVLEVTDTGPGIPPELRDKVFQLYFTTKTRGSGIGLAMTYRAVQLHNGTIEFVSDGNRGTTFRLQFPALAGHA